MTRAWKSRPFDPPRPLHACEREALAALLSQPFAGRDQLADQLAHATVVEEGCDDTATIVFGYATDSIPRAEVVTRIPVEATARDLDGMSVTVLLHVVDGRAVELEIFRIDGGPIQRREIGRLDQVVINLH